MNVRIEEVYKKDNHIYVKVSYPGAVNQATFIFKDLLPSEVAIEVVDTCPKDRIDTMRGMYE